MPMREDCTFYEHRSYPTGEVARFCTLDLAPEAPWRCPEGCARYERILFIGGDFDAGSLGAVPPVPAAPDADSDDLVAVLDAAEDIVNAAVPDILSELDWAQARTTPWWRRRRRGRGGGGDVRLSGR